MMGRRNCTKILAKKLTKIKDPCKKNISLPIQKKIGNYYWIVTSTQFLQHLHPPHPRSFRSAPEENNTQTVSNTRS